MSYLAWILGGVVSIVMGIIVFVEGGVPHRGFFIKGKFPGIVFIIMGIASFYMVPRALKHSEKEEKTGGYLKCPECGKVYHLYERQDFNCSECHKALEPLKGFFEKHPNFKDD